MKALYIHGLESKGLSEEKHRAFNDLGIMVDAPRFNYFEEKNVFQWLMNVYDANRYDIIVGSSIGGMLAYHLSNVRACPALLFNPAIYSERSNSLQAIPGVIRGMANAGDKMVVLGMEDEVIDPEQVIARLSADATIVVVSEMGHRVPVKVFKTALGSFVGKLKMELV